MINVSVESQVGKLRANKPVIEYTTVYKEYGRRLKFGYYFKEIEVYEQYETHNFPVLHLGMKPAKYLKQFSNDLQIFEEFFHCLGSEYDLAWEYDSKKKETKDIFTINKFSLLLQRLNETTKCRILRFGFHVEMAEYKDKGLRRSQEDRCVATHLHYHCPQCFLNFNEKDRDTILDLFRSCSLMDIQKEIKENYPHLTDTEIEGIMNWQTNHTLHYGAVFDGHVGDGCAEFAKNNLHKNIEKHLHGNTVHEAILKGYAETEKDFLEKAEKEKNESGTTALTVIQGKGKRVWVANCGDCHAILCRSRDGKPEHVVLSNVHNPRSEEQRILKEGGTVDNNGRLNNNLAVSRSLGDLDFQNGGQKTKGLSAVPVITEHVLEDKDEFIILCSDGVHEAVDFGKCVRIVRRVLKQTNNVKLAAEKLVKTALKSNHGDNMSAVVLGFARTHGANDYQTIVPDETKI